jgi:hypothetical protein
MSNTQPTNSPIANPGDTFFKSIQKRLDRRRADRDSTFRNLQKAATFDPQKESPFFQIPPEIRCRIYELLASSWYLDTDIHVDTPRDDAGNITFVQGASQQEFKLISFCCILEVDPQVDIKPWSAGSQGQLGSSILPACFPCQDAHKANLVVSKDSNIETKISILTTCKRQYVTPN